MFKQEMPQRPNRRNELEPLVALNFRVPLHIRKQLKIEAAARGITMTELILRAVTLLRQQRET